MRAMGDRVTQDQTDPQYMFLRQRLAGLEEGWEELQRMWDNRQHLLSQGLNLQASEISCLSAFMIFNHSKFLFRCSFVMLNKLKLSCHNKKTI